MQSGPQPDFLSDDLLLGDYTYENNPDPPTAFDELSSSSIRNSESDLGPLPHQDSIHSNRSAPKSDDDLSYDATAMSVHSNKSNNSNKSKPPPPPSTPPKLRAIDKKIKSLESKIAEQSTSLKEILKLLQKKQTIPPPPQTPSTNNANTSNTIQIQPSSDDKDKKLNLRNYVHNMQNPTAAKQYMDHVTLELQQKHYFSVLLKDGKIDFTATSHLEQDRTLHSQLMSRIDLSYRTIMTFDANGSGLYILKDIASIYKNATFTQQSLHAAQNFMLNGHWDPASQLLIEFAAAFANHSTILANSIAPPSPKQILQHWIHLLPSTLFQDLQTTYHTDTLQDHWKNLDTSKISQLLQATQTEIKIRNITIPQKKKKKDRPEKQQPGPSPTPAPSPAPSPAPAPAPAPSQQRRPPLPRVPLPYKYSPSTLGMNFGEYLRDLQATDKKDDLKKVIKDLQDGWSTVCDGDVDGCPLCRIKPGHYMYHKMVDCNFLKSLNFYTRCYRLSSSSSSPPPPTMNKIYKWIYDSGTFPYHLVKDLDLFSHYTPYTDKRSCRLGNGSPTPALGEGTIDVAIKGKRVRAFAVHVPALEENLFSSAEHLKYTGNFLVGANNIKEVIFPSLSLVLLSATEWSFHTTNGNNTSLPIAFDHNTATLSSDNALPSFPLPNQQVLYTLTHDKAIVPTKATTGSSGYDITTPDPIILPPHSTTKCHTGIKLQIPKGLHCKIEARSSLALKGISIGGGIIDSDYRDEIIVLLQNSSDTRIKIPCLHRIAQFLFYYDPAPTFAPGVLNSTDRKGGFGSTNCKRMLTRNYSNAVTQKNQEQGGSLDSKIIKEGGSMFNSIVDFPPLSTDSLPPLVHASDDSDSDSDSDTDSDSDSDSESVIDPNNTDTTVTVSTPNEKDDPTPNEKDDPNPPSITTTPSPSPIVEDVHEDQSQKEVHDDAIDLFPDPPSTSTPTNTTPTNDTSAQESQEQSPNTSTTSTPTSPDPNQTQQPSTFFPEHEYIDHIRISTSTPQPSNVTKTTTLPTFSKILPKDRVSSTEPKMKFITTDFLQKSIGYRKIDQVLKTMKDVAQPTVTIRDTGKDPILSRGEVATLPKKKRNTTPLPQPDKDIYHYDIGYGKGRAIGNIHYVLFIVSRRTRHKYIYGLQNLTDTSITSALEQFVGEIGGIPDEMIADRDFKLIGQHVDKFFNHETIITGAPQGRQSSNGLSEVNWKHVCNMARNFMTEKLMSDEYWFLALQYAVQVSNMLAIKTDTGQLTTPFFLQHGEPPDYRKLLPLFSAAHAKVYTSGQGNTLNCQTMQCILVGNDPKSNGQLFYSPNSRSFIGSVDYVLDTHVPTGIAFNLDYQGGFDQLYNLYSDDYRYKAPTYAIGQSVFVKSPSNPDLHVKCTIISIPFRPDEPYTIQYPASKEIEQLQESDILPFDPASQPTTNPVPSLPWIQDKTKVTLKLDGWEKPKQGYLVDCISHGPTGKLGYHFLPGRNLSQKEKSQRNNPNKLWNSMVSLGDDDFPAQAESLYNSKRLQKNWVQTKTFEEYFNADAILQSVARRIAFTNSIHPQDISDEAIAISIQRAKSKDFKNVASARKVSAANLQSNIEPKLHEHHILCDSDKEIWDEAYLEEYMGLHRDTKTWEYITEEEYQSLRKVVGNALPSMAISKIKRENGKPTRAKYRIVVLGNLDPHAWTSSDCFAPVLSSMELRLLIGIAVQMKRNLKGGDVSQAFVQAVLPEDEKYIVRPPKGCPITPSNTYLFLKKTLYGLKRSPRHWYIHCKNTLESMGLHPLPNAPCIFIGTLIEGQPPLILGLFVDDFIYFSESDEVEAKFKSIFGKKYKVDFSDSLTSFLGLNVQQIRHDDGELTVYLDQGHSILNLIAKAGLDKPGTASKKTPYRSGHPVDSIEHQEMSESEREKLNKILQEYVGELNWLSTQTRPDISTITNIIAQYNSKCSKGHIDAAKYVIRYLLGTKDRGICFSSRHNATVEAFVKFPIDPNKILPVTDANWGPQDASKPDPNKTYPKLDLFKSRSIAGYIIWFGGPLHWQAKRQGYTARSSGEAEVGSVDDCTRVLQLLRNILKDLGLYDRFVKEPITIYNDNRAAVDWSHNMTSKGMRHIQLKENAVRENVETGFIEVNHIAGENNFSDIMTKEDKDPLHYTSIANIITCKIPKESLQESFKGGIVTSEAPCDVIDTERCRGPPTTHISVANDPP